MSDLIIRAYIAPDGTVVGEVVDVNDKVLATCANGYEDKREAYAAASAKRDEIEARWTAQRERVASHKPREWYEL